MNSHCTVGHVSVSLNNGKHRKGRIFKSRNKDIKDKAQAASKPSLQTSITMTLKLRFWYKKEFSDVSNNYYRAPFAALSPPHTEPSVIHLKYLFKNKSKNVLKYRGT